METLTTPLQKAAGDSFLDQLKNDNPGEIEFHQAVEEVYESIQPVIEQRKDYRDHSILQRIVEPERIVSFRVTWMDDQGVPQVNKAYRGTDEQRDRPL